MSNVLPNRTEYNRADRRVTVKGKRAIVRLPIPYRSDSKMEASPGDFVTFKVNASEGNPSVRHGRVVGRVDADGSSGADQTPVKGWLCVAMLSVEMTFAHEMWVKPEDVISCVAVANHVDFYRVFFTADPADLLRMSEYGSLGVWNHRTNKLPETK